MSNAPFILPQHAAQMSEVKQAQAQQQHEQRVAAIQLINSIALDVYTRTVEPGMNDIDLRNIAEFAKRSALIFAEAAGMVAKRSTTEEEGGDHA